MCHSYNLAGCVAQEPLPFIILGLVLAIMAGFMILGWIRP